MASRCPSEWDIIDSIISDTTKLLHQLEEVRSAVTNHKHALGGPEQRAAAKQLIYCTRFVAILRGISQTAQAYIAEFEGPETHKETWEETSDIVCIYAPSV